MEASDALRALIEKVVLTPEPDGLAAELHGDLAMILAAAAGSRRAPLPARGPSNARTPGERLFLGGSVRVNYRWLRGQDLNL